MLKQQGVDATYQTPPDFNDQAIKGTYTGVLHRDRRKLGRSVLPHAAVPVGERPRGGAGQHQPLERTDEYDKIVDQFVQTPLTEKDKLLGLYVKAMEQWLPNLPVPQITEWYHRIPCNQTYWTGWPTNKDPYVNSAFWHWTFPLMLEKFEPAQSKEGSPRAFRLRAQAARHLPGRDLGGVHPQLLAAQALDPKPDPRQADVTGCQYRLPPAGPGRDDGRVRGEIRTRPAGLAAVHRLHDRRRPARLQLLDHQLPTHGAQHDPGRSAVDDRAVGDDDGDRVHPRHAARGADGLASGSEVHLAGCSSRRC